MNKLVVSAKLCLVLFLTVIATSHSSAQYIGDYPLITTCDTNLDRLPYLHWNGHALDLYVIAPGTILKQSGWRPTIQLDSTSSDTVISNGSTYLILFGGASSLTLTDPPSPVPGQLWIISTRKGQSGTSLRWTNIANFVAAPASIVNTNGLRFIWEQTGNGIYQWYNY